VSRETGHSSKFSTCEGSDKGTNDKGDREEIYDLARTSCAKSAQHAGTASMLKTAEPTMVPTPRSPSVTKVPMTLMNNSGLELAAAITVAPATSSVTLSSARHFCIRSIENCV